MSPHDELRLVAEPSGLEFRVLGALQAMRDGEALSLGGPKQRAVLALLLLEAPHAVSAEALIDALWESNPPPGALKTLRSYLSRLRAVLGPEVLVTRPPGYALEIDPVQLDAHRFEQLVREGEKAFEQDSTTLSAELFRRALALWRGAALADVAEHALLALESRRLEALRLTALEGRIEADLALGLHAQVAGELEKLVAEHPLRERLWRELVLALYRCERQAEALAAYARARELLSSELGLEPSEQLRQLQQAVLRQDVAAVSPEAEPSNLPAQLTSFIGRQHELDEVERLLGETRLLTVTGLGGVGKTRFVLEVASGAVARGDVVRFVDLSGTADPARVPQRVLDALGLRESLYLPTLDVLRNYLRQREVLLVLDNCEHLLGASAELADALLRGVAGLHVLATSREPLGVFGEVDYALLPLAVPMEGLDADELAQVPAVQLFLDRAASMRSDFAARPEAVATVARICSELDGIPLAIELAAARTKALSVEEIAAHLDQRFDFLRYWRRVGIPRQQTLRATMDWSYELLSEPERRGLRRLSVCAGGFTLEAASSVYGDEATAIDIVGRLVDKSLVIAELRQGGARYRLLETVRQYAAELLAEAGELDEARSAHAFTFLRLVEEAGRGKHSSAKDVLSRLALEHDNFRSALDWSFSSGTDIGPRLARALGGFWLARGHFPEARTWLERALEEHPVEDELRAELLALLGIVSKGMGDLEAAERVLSHGLQVAKVLGHSALGARIQVALADVRADLSAIRLRDALDECEDAAAKLEAAGDDSGLAEAWCSIGKFRFWLGETPADEEALERAASYARRAGNRGAELLALEWLAVSFITLRVPVDVAIRRQEQLLAEVAGEPRAEAGVLMPLAWVYGFAGRFADAREALTRGRARLAELGSKLDWAAGAMNAGAIELMAGDPVAAERELREGYEALITMGGRGYLDTTASFLAEALYVQERYDEAQQLTDEAEASASGPGDGVQPEWRAIRAKLHARRGELSRALPVANEAVLLAAATGHASMLGEALMAKAEVLQLAERPEDAATALCDALRIYEDRRAFPLAARARALLAKLAVDLARSG